MTSSLLYIKDSTGAIGVNGGFVGYDHDNDTLTNFAQSKVSIAILEAEVAYFTDTDFYVDKSTTIDDNLTVDGNVGIGTTSPDVKLHIDGGDLKVRDSGNVAIQIVSSDSGQSAIQFGDDGDTNDGRIVYMNATDLMRFFTNDSEKMVINSSGNVGIGTDSPDSLLHVAKDSSNSQLTLERTGSATGKFKIYTNTNSLYFYDEAQSSLRMKNGY